MLKLGFFLGQQALQRLSLDRIDFGRKKFLEVGDVQVRNCSIHDSLLRKSGRPGLLQPGEGSLNLVYDITWEGWFPPPTTVIVGARIR